LSERTAYPINLGDLVDRGRDLSKVAFIDLRVPDRPRNCTYADIEEMSRGVARLLTKRGFAKGTRIAILSLNRAEYVATYFGIMRAGLVAVPVNIKLPRATTYLEAIARYRVTALNAVPTMLARAAKEADLLQRLDLSSVRRVNMG
jgi:acyl-CoA synthetase (AMP-forming)/AMP-acid ligase II